MITDAPTSLPSTGERLLTEWQNEYVAEHLHRYAVAMDLCADKEVLDIASGEGYGSNLLADVARSVVGVDIARDAIEHASAKYERANLKFVVGSVADIPLASGSIDVAVSFETLEHHDEHEAMLLEIRRVLKPSGLLVISTPDRLNYSDRCGIANKWHVKELYVDEFRELIGKYFKGTSLYFQAMTFGSIIVPERATSGLNFIEGDFAQLRRSATLPMAFYNIIIASNASLPSLPISIFGTSLEASEALQAKIEQLAVAERRVQNISATLKDLESSASFRVGRALTAPLRWLTGRR